MHEGQADDLAKGVLSNIDKCSTNACRAGEIRQLHLLKEIYVPLTQQASTGWAGHWPLKMEGFRTLG